ncbi:MAG: carbohydrate-binding family 9-like protein [Gemmatimonadetes bacterium]|jgi:hypothetical protein|nr:carbohydrate-binding family 9-like protein [Gemmatimonadota bacterium]
MARIWIIAALLLGMDSISSAQDETEGEIIVVDSNKEEKPRRIENFPSYETPGFQLACSSGQEPYDHLPPVVRYECRRTEIPIIVDGKLDEEVWQRVEWSQPFQHIVTGEEASVETRVALLWDDEFLYVGYKVENHDVRGTMGSYHDHVYMKDNDVEIFVEGDGYYYEMGINPLNNIYELRWTWLEPLVRENRFVEIEALLKIEDYLYYVAREGDQLGRIGDLNYHLPGLKTAVHIDGVLNQPGIRDNGWTVEFALPWKGLQAIAGGKAMPPNSGDMLGIMGYRMHHFREKDREGEHEASTWNAVGCGNIHIPERWSEVIFVDDSE